MPRQKRQHSLVRRVALLGCLAVAMPAAALGSFSAINVASAKADFALSTTPLTQTVTQGSAATFTVTMTPNNGYKGTVTLTAQPVAGAGVTASFAPSSVNYKVGTSTLTVSTANATPGTYGIRISGSDGTLSHDAAPDLTLTIKPLQAQFTVAAQPSSAQVLPGDVAQFGVSVTRAANYSQTVNLAVAGLPNGVSPSWTPSSSLAASENSAVLQLTTSSGAPTGTFTVRISGTDATNATSSTTVQLAILDKGKPFSVSGAPNGFLAPGADALPIDLVLTNPNNQAMNVTNLTVTVVGTDKGSACGPENFFVRQMDARYYPLALAKGSSGVTLTQLRVPVSAFPGIAMIDAPSVSQDACKDAKVYLSYSGTATGGN